VGGGWGWCGHDIYVTVDILSEIKLNILLTLNSAMIENKIFHFISFHIFFIK
jgi:hypothetical protein